MHSYFRVHCLNINWNNLRSPRRSLSGSVSPKRYQPSNQNNQRQNNYQHGNNNQNRGNLSNQYQNNDNRYQGNGYRYQNNGNRYQNGGNNYQNNGNRYQNNGNWYHNNGNRYQNNGYHFQNNGRQNPGRYYPNRDNNVRRESRRESQVWFFNWHGRASKQVYRCPPTKSLNCYLFLL